MKIHHSKYKNTGLLFELLIRQITADTLKGEDSPAIDLLKKYFVKTKLGLEQKLYESIIKSKTINETQANIIISTILEGSQKFNKDILRKQKYNLINEIKKHYDLESFFCTQIKNYKELAAIYTLIEGHKLNQITNPNQLINSKLTLLEYLTKKPINNNIKENILNEFKDYDKDLRILTYRILLEKFNEKYKNLNINQKQILKEYINSVDSTPNLREFYNSKIKELKSLLLKESKKITDKVTQIKVIEVSKLLNEIDKNHKVEDNNLINLLKYYELIDEIKKINNV